MRVAIAQVQEACGRDAIADALLMDAAAAFPNVSRGCLLRKMRNAGVDECRGQLVIFYPKSHCELNFIERYWCGCKWYAGENCQYILDGLRGAVRAALCSVSSATINQHYLHCMRITNAYGSGAIYGTKEFKERVYKARQNIVDKPKW